MPKRVDNPQGAPGRAGSQLFTLGYEGLTADRCLDIIQAAGVETLVDVRRTPLSRKPGLSKRRLDEACAARGMRYVHMIALGTPRDVLYAYRDSHDHAEFERAFRAYLAEQGDAVRELADLARQESCCLLCVEADPKSCHRHIVAEAVQKTLGPGVCEVVDLMA